MDSNIFLGRVAALDETFRRRSEGVGLGEGDSSVQVAGCILANMIGMADSFFEDNPNDVRALETFCDVLGGCAHFVESGLGQVSFAAEIREVAACYEPELRA